MYYYFSKEEIEKIYFLARENGAFSMEKEGDTMQLLEAYEDDHKTIIVRLNNVCIEEITTHDKKHGEIISAIYYTIAGAQNIRYAISKGWTK